MKKQRTKRLAALVLALAMTLSTLSLPVYAADISETVSDAADTLLAAETEEAETPSAEDADETGDESVAEESTEDAEATTSESTEVTDSETAEAEQIVTAAETLAPSATDKVGLEEESGWYYGSGWEWQYSGADNSSVTQENGMVKATVDFSADSGYSYSKMAISYYSDDGVSLEGVNQVTLDFYYDEANMTSGSFQMTFYSDVLQLGETAVDMSAAETVEDTLKKVSVTLTGDSASGSVNGITFCLIGVNTNYQGDLWLDNVQFAQGDADEEDVYVNSTVALDDKTNLSVSGNTLTSQTEDGADETTSIATSVTLVDGNATENTAKIYALLQALGNSKSVIFGHQNDTWHKTGSSSLGSSDVEDITQSISGVVGIDTLSLVGDEYSAERYNNEHDSSEIDIATLGEARANVKAAAELTNENIEAGAIITLSAHMPNFSTVSLNESYDEETDPTYAKYDFNGYTPNILTGDVMNEILPGGAYNEVYNAFLDMVADYASQVNGTILFRPFHENTGSWFWWGKAFCDAETYKNVYRYTVEYLRDEKGVHNFLYVYGPGSEAADEDEYEERYPGDNYVDIIGFDMYNSDPQEDNSTWLATFQAELALVDSFAQKHDKLLAVTETGVSNSTSSEAALLKSGNQDQQWFEEVADIVSQSNASYFLVWANFGINSGFYTPYVVSVNEDGTLYGHELLDPFITFFNDGRSVFAENLKGILEQMSTVSVEAAATTATGYLTSPVSGSRLLTETTVTAKLTGASDKTVAEIVLHGDGADVTLTAATTDGSYYSAMVDTDTLESLGEYVGTIELFIDGESFDRIRAIFNIEETEADPYLVDDFESYYGVDSLLTSTWATNKASGSTISLTLTDADGEAQEGFGLNFTYSETSGGWAGATISKEVDWSDCNALQFWTIPDANQQKVVIQIQANDTCYEAYLNLYEEYAALAGQPTLVTIPFSEFCQRDTEGNPTGGLVNDCSSVTSFGLWVNAIDNEYFDGDTVSGSIWYDNITAVSTDLTEATFTALTQEETVDTSALTTAIEQAEALTESDYTADSWSALQTALAAAQTVAANAAATQSEADEAATALTSAISALETLPVVDSSALTAVIEQAETLTESDYTTDSWSALQTALESAKILAANGSATQDEVDEAAAALTSAISTLEVAEKVTVPSATKITSAANKAKGIKLTWNAVDGATSYQVYRKIGSGSWKKVKTTSSTTWLDTAAMKNGTKYQYKVYAVNDSGKSSASATKKIYRLTAKHFTRAKNISGKKVSLKWTRNTKATGYVIQYSTSKSFTSSTTKTVKVKGNKNLTTTLKNLKKGKTYYIRMRPYKTSGSVTSYAGWSKVKKVKVKK